MRYLYQDRSPETAVRNDPVVTWRGSDLPPAGDISTTLLAKASLSMKGGGNASLLKACHRQVTRQPRQLSAVPDLVATVDPGGLLHCARGDDHPHAPVPAQGEQYTSSSSDRGDTVKGLL